MSVATRLVRRRLRRAAMDHDVFEKEFALESLKSDRLSVTILNEPITNWLRQDLQDFT